jgi:phosphoglycolate phosphatase-like HAD superfamily hydrolase
MNRTAPRQIDTCLFDLDGTLINSIELIRQSYAHTLRAHGVHGQRFGATQKMRVIGKLVLQRREVLGL